MSSAPACEKLAFQPPHALTPTEKTFLASLSEKEKELHKLASEMLGSSYFVGKTHSFGKWMANLGKPPQVTK
jgi:hypothetical protein